MSDRRSIPIRLAFLGCGWATRMHSRTLRSVAPGVQRFYASRDPARASEYARRYAGAGWFNSYDAAIADERIHALFVATPPSAHLEWALAGLDAGKDVIVEKPAFPCSSDFARVRERERPSSGMLLVAENYRYKPLTLALRDWIARREPDDLRFIRVNATRLRSWEGWRGDPDLAGGGTLMEGGIHWLSLMASLGLEVETVQGFRAGSGEGPDRSVLVVLRYVGGCVGTLNCSWEVHAPLRGLRVSQVYGTHGSLLFESNGVFLASWRDPLRFTLPGLRDIAGYRAMFRDFLKVIRTRAAPLYTLDDAERDIRLVERATGSLPDAGPASAEAAAGCVPAASASRREAGPQGQSGASARTASIRA